MCFCFLPPSGVNQGDTFHFPAESLPLRTAAWKSPLGLIFTLYVCFSSALPTSRETPEWGRLKPAHERAHQKEAQNYSQELLLGR